MGERELDSVGLLRKSASPRRWLDLLEDIGFDRERVRGFGVGHAPRLGWDREGQWSRAHIDSAWAILVA